MLYYFGMKRYVLKITQINWLIPIPNNNVNKMTNEN